MNKPASGLNRQRIEERFVQWDTDLAALLEMFAEMNLRLLYIMRTMELTLPMRQGLLDATGHRELRKLSLYDHYHLNKRAFLETLDREQHQHDASTTTGTNGDGAAAPPTRGRVNP